MEIQVTFSKSNIRKKINIKKDSAILDLLKKIDIKPDTVIITKKNKPITVDEVLNKDEELTIIQISSSG